MIRERLFCLALVLLIGCNSETFTEVEKNRAPLIAGFESYASLDEVKAKLPPDLEVKVVEDTALTKKADSRPPYEVYAIAITSFEHLHQPGLLLLTFYNNRLEQSAFYPAKFSAYLGALEKSGVKLGFGRELVRGNTLIWEGVDADQKRYIGWADKRLRDQRRRWLARYD